MPSMELLRRLYLTSVPALLVQRRLRWFKHAARLPDGEVIKDHPHRRTHGAGELETS